MTKGLVASLLAFVISLTAFSAAPARAADTMDILQLSAEADATVWDARHRYRDRDRDRGRDRWRNRNGRDHDWRRGGPRRGGHWRHRRGGGIPRWCFFYTRHGVQVNWACVILSHRWR